MSELCTVNSLKDDFPVELIQLLKFPKAIKYQSMNTMNLRLLRLHFKTPENYFHLPIDRHCVALHHYWGKRCDLASQIFPRNYWSPRSSLTHRSEYSGASHYHRTVKEMNWLACFMLELSTFNTYYAAYEKALI